MSISHHNRNAATQSDIPHGIRLARGGVPTYPRTATTVGGFGAVPLEPGQRTLFQIMAMTPNLLRTLLLAASACLCPASFFAGQAAETASPRTIWKGVHLMAPDSTRLDTISKAITNQLAPMGVTVVVLEVGYKFDWKSHPELRIAGALTREDAGGLAAACRQHGIRLIPLFNCLGHQSWAKKTLPLLTKHPEFDETPNIPPDNPNIYCRSWCPLHPDVNRIVFALMDELLEAFQADALHVGMDEVFLIGSDQCARCKGKDPAQLFAQAVKDYHSHIVGKRKATMLMWGDRLLDDANMKYGEWEASRNRTAGAVDMIPKDIVICDWHYEPRESYPSVPFFEAKGFRVWPSSWRNKAAAAALLEYSQRESKGKVVGHLCTTWSGSEQIARALAGESGDSLAQARQVVEALRACMEALRDSRVAPSSR